MLRSMWSATTGLKNHQTWMDSVGHNISNVSTTAYKSNEVSFSDLMYQQMNPAVAGTGNSATTNAKQVGLGVGLASTRINAAEQGSMITTNEPLDTMLVGNSFYIVQGDDGNNYYTKDGSFTIDTQGNLTLTSAGYYVKGWPSTDGETVDTNGATGQLNFFQVENFENMNGYSLNEDGKIYARYSDGTAPKLIGQIAVVTFDNPMGLGRVGGNLFEATQNSGRAVVHDVTTDGGFIKTGMLEASNVSLSNEFTDMILSQRGFQMNSKAIQTSDQILQVVNGLKQ